MQLGSPRTYLGPGTYLVVNKHVLSGREINKCKCFLCWGPNFSSREKACLKKDEEKQVESVVGRETDGTALPAKSITKQGSIPHDVSRGWEMKYFLLYQWTKGVIATAATADSELVSLGGTQGRRKNTHWLAAIQTAATQWRWKAQDVENQEISPRWGGAFQSNDFSEPVLPLYFPCIEKC